MRLECTEETFTVISPLSLSDWFCFKTFFSPKISANIPVSHQGPGMFCVSDGIPHDRLFFSVLLFLCFYLLTKKSNIFLSHITEIIQAGGGSPDLQRASISIISTPTRGGGATDSLMAAITTATVTCPLSRRLLCRFAVEPCQKTTSVLTAVIAGRRLFLWGQA